MPTLEFIQDDFLDKNIEWASKGDVIFANATCFEQTMVDKVESIIETNMREGSVLIISSKNIKNEKNLFRVVGHYNLDMSWGEATINVYIKESSQAQ